MLPDRDVLPAHQDQQSAPTPARPLGRERLQGFFDEILHRIDFERELGDDAVFAVTLFESLEVDQVGWLRSLTKRPFRPLPSYVAIRTSVKRRIKSSISV